MRLYRYPSRDSWSEIIRRPSRSTEDLLGTVRPIFEAVRQRGDDAIRELTLKFDQVEVDELRVTAAEVAAASEKVPASLKEALKTAAANIERFHRAQLEQPAVVETMPGVRCWRRSVPIDPVGLYIPGGLAPLFSTVLMLGIPASVAGCGRIVLATPPGREGRIHPAILYAADLVGIREIYRVGGAQAIAAMTIGTPSIPRVNKIFGPGNQYVTAAKQLSLLEGGAIDIPAGPTEVALVADESCDPRFAAWDILSQAEHGPDSHILFVTDNAEYAGKVLAAVKECVGTLPRKAIATDALRHGAAVVVEDLDEAMDLVNFYAPEHLILASRTADRLVDGVENAGSVFVGHLSPEAAGDYATGTNHTLPTGGHARAWSGVSVDSFVKKITFQQLSAVGLRNVGPAVECMAEAEGLQGHKRAVSVRLETLD